MKNNAQVRYMYPEVRKSETDERTITFVASDGSRDSARTVLNQKGWDLTRFNKNGVIGYQHDIYGGWDNDPDKVIGKGRAYVEGERLLVDITFEPEDINPLAEKIYKKVLFGSLKAVSVGFLPIGRGAWGKGEEGPGQERETYYYAGQELLEVSVVNIPANPNAVRKSDDEAAKELDALREEALREIAEEEAKKKAAQEPEDHSAEIEKVLITARAALLN